MSLRVGVSGAKGYIGSLFCVTLAGLGHRVVPVDLRSDTQRRVEGLDAFVHLASETPQGASRNTRSSTNVYEANLELTRRALAISQVQQCRFIFSSSYLYRNGLTGTVSEVSELNLSNDYRKSKRDSEILCELFSLHSGISTTVLRIANVFGPGQKMSFLVPALITQVLGSDHVRIRTTDVARDLIFVEDVVDALLRALQIDSGFQIFNVGSGRSAFISEVLTIIEDQVGRKLPRIWGTEDSGGDAAPMDFSRFQAVTDWLPQTDLHAGLARTVQAFHQELRSEPSRKA